MQGRSMEWEQSPDTLATDILMWQVLLWLAVPSHHALSLLGALQRILNLSLCTWGAGSPLPWLRVVDEL